MNHGIFARSNLWVRRCVAVVASAALAVALLPTTALAAWRHEEVPASIAAESGLTALTANQAVSVSFDANKTTKKWFTFKAPATKKYTFYSSSTNADSYGVLYAQTGTMLTMLERDDDGGLNSNFMIVEELTAGTTYYLCASMYNSLKTGTISVGVADKILLGQYDHSMTIPSLETVNPITYASLKLQIGSHEYNSDEEEVFVPLPAGSFAFAGWYQEEIDGDYVAIGSDPAKGPSKPGRYAVKVTGTGDYAGEQYCAFDLDIDSSFGSLDLAYKNASGDTVGADDDDDDPYIKWDLANGPVSFNSLGIQLGTWSYDDDHGYVFTSADSTFSFVRWRYWDDRDEAISITDANKTLSTGYYTATIQDTETQLTRSFYVSVIDSRDIGYLSSRNGYIERDRTGTALKYSELNIELGAWSEYYDEEEDEYVDVFTPIDSSAYSFANWCRAEGTVTPIGSDPNAGPVDPGFYLVRLVATAGSGYTGEAYVGIRIVDPYDLTNYETATWDPEIVWTGNPVAFSDLTVKLGSEKDDGSWVELDPSVYEFGGWYRFEWNEIYEDSFTPMGTNPAEGPVDHGEYAVRINAVSGSGYTGHTYARFSIYNEHALSNLHVKWSGRSRYYDYDGEDDEDIDFDLNGKSKVTLADLAIELGTFAMDSDEDGDDCYEVVPVDSSQYAFTAWLDSNHKVIGTDPANGPSARGSYYVRFTATSGSDYAGYKDVYLYINRLDLGDTTVVGVDAKYQETGSAIAPKPNIIDSRDELLRDTDYTLSYKNNVKPGTATIVITGKGKYAGSSITKTFTITAKPVAGTKPVAGLKVGTSAIVGGATYKATSATEVSYSAAPNKKSVTVPDTVAVNGKTYSVTEVGAKAFVGKKIRTVTIGKNVKKLAKNALSSSKATKMIVKTTKLTKKKVKGSLKGSKIKTVQVKVGKKKVNKKYVKKYKKIFTKKNAGKKVKIK